MQSLSSSAAVPAVLELSGLSVKLGQKEVLKQVTASLRGQCIGLLGPNGAGKSTLLNTLLGFHVPSAGDARVFGCSVVTSPLSVKALLGYMPERDVIIPGMTAVHFLRMMGELAGLSASAALERAHELLYLVGLGEVRYRAVETCSLGLKQRIRLAQALMHGPRLLLLDEPTNGLDPNARQQLLRLIQAIRDQGETQLLLSSHLLKDVEECCDEVLILHQGQVVEQCDLGQARQVSSRFIELELAGDEVGMRRFRTALELEGSTLVQSGLRRGAGGSGSSPYDLQEGGPVPGLGGGRLTGVLSPQVDVQRLYQQAQAAGVQIRRLSFKRQSLEEIFFRAIGELDGRL